MGILLLDKLALEVVGEEEEEKEKEEEVEKEEEKVLRIAGCRSPPAAMQE